MKKTIKDVTEAKLDFVIATLKVDFPNISKVKQDNGLWTVTGKSLDTEISSSEENNINSFSGSNVSSAAIDILARTIWGEARGESTDGKKAVASVILNRLKKPDRFGSTIEGVCQKPFQFSCWNDNDPNLPKLKVVDSSEAHFAECLSIAKEAVEGSLIDSTLGADHYHTTGVSPAWAQGKTSCKKIGDHLFYNNIS